MNRVVIEKLAPFIKRHVGIVSVCVVGFGIASSVMGSYLLRFDFHVSEVASRNPEQLLIPALLIKGFVIWRMRLFNSWWQYASLADVVEIFRATIYSSLFLTCFAVLFYRLEGIPRSVLVLDAVLTFSYLAGVRFIVRLVREVYMPATSLGRRGSSKVFVVGAGEAGQSVVREVRKSHGLNTHIVGYLDDDPLKRNLKFQGVPVLGRIDDLRAVAQDFEVNRIIVAIPGASGREMRRIVDLCSSTGLKVQTLPGLSDLIDGKVTVQQIRDVDVRDLLGRRAINLDSQGLESFIGGKCVLVTGAAGSIGSELCRQIIRFNPAKIVLFDSSESPLFFLDRELKDQLKVEVVPVIGNVRHRHSLEQLFKEYQPQVVFHAAAYKHVPLMENQPDSAVSVNVLGTKVLADMSEKFGVDSFVMVSTDKAVNPTSVMGATKRCAEMYIQTLSRTSKTRFVTVRFGNVLDSAGSVIPIFRKQIREGGPVTVTHPEVTRFFMTIPEAAQLVVQAGCMGQGGEIYLLDMGEPVKILYLAEEMIRLSGFTPNEDIKIAISGLRPGEKLYEELLLAGEGTQPTENSAIKIARAETLSVIGFDEKLNKLLSLGPLTPREIYLKSLSELVPEYTPHEAQESNPAVS